MNTQDHEFWTPSVGWGFTTGTFHLCILHVCMKTYNILGEGGGGGDGGIALGQGPSPIFLLVIVISRLLPRLLPPPFPGPHV